MLRSWRGNNSGGSNPSALLDEARKADEQGRLVEAFALWFRLAEDGGGAASFEVGLRYENGAGILQNFNEATSWFHRAADLGWVEAYGKLGDIYFTGRSLNISAERTSTRHPIASKSSVLTALSSRAAGVTANHSEAAKWNLLAAELGDSRAQVRLAYQYASKLGVGLDYAAAEWWFSKAAAQDEPSGQLGLGMLLAGGHGRPVDALAARQWFEKSARQGNANAKTCLSFLLSQGSANEKGQAFSLIQEAAATRIPEAMFLLGEYRRFGIGCEKDDSEAESWLRRAALAGHRGAMAAAGALLQNRRYPDFTSAAAFFREASDLGHPQAQFALGQMYALGQGVPQDHKLSAICFGNAAVQGVTSAYQRLGAMYAEGVGLKQDFQAAAEWFGKAAAEGHPSAFYQMAVLHHYGLGVPANADKALALYQKASAEGDARASLRLGILFAEGELVDQSWDSAARYYGIAAGQGSADAELNLAFVMIRGLALGDIDLGLAFLVESAEAGNSKGIWALYTLYRDGVYLPIDQVESDKWLMRAVEEGSSVAVAELANRLTEGRPTPLPGDKIVALLGVTAASGDVQAMAMLGRILYEGKHHPTDPSAAHAWLTRAASRGDAFAQAWLGDVLAAGKDVKRDPAASKLWYWQAARQGHTGALLALTAAEPGVDQSQDDEIFELWLKLANAGDPLAQRMVGDYSLRGVRCPQSTEDGVAWLRKASAQGNTASKLILSGALLNGFAPQIHPSEASDLMHAVAAEGNVDACYNLGVCYRLGLSVSADQLTARHWYERAAKQNHPQAQLAMGDIILEVSNTDNDLAEARTWYTAAARAGVPKAALSLGRMLEAGLGVQRDRRQAFEYYRQAANAGLEEGKAGLERCKDAMETS